MRNAGKNPESGDGVPDCTKTGLQQELHARPPAIAWTIAGFDPSSGAGVTADLQTFAAHGLFGCSAITALTVQTTLGVFGVEPVSPDVLLRTLERLDEDLPAAGIKIGMLGSAEIAGVVGRFFADRSGQRPVVVLDPVLRSSSGRTLYPDAALRVLREELLPHVDWITPNWAELSVLAGTEVRDGAEASAALEAVGQAFPRLGIVATGGDQENPDDLVRLVSGRVLRFAGEHVETTSTHGTGCAFSSALLCELVRGAEAERAVPMAKRFVEGALRAAPGVGGGRGPMDLLWPLRAAGARPGEDC